MSAKHGQVVSKSRGDRHRAALLTATEKVLGVDIGDSENETFWTEFLRDAERLEAFNGVRLVISDAHTPV